MTYEQFMRQENTSAIHSTVDLYQATYIFNTEVV
jgi:hypothetical protein